MSPASTVHSRVTRGVIVAAGYGTRFLPITKTVPKEMLPLVDRPALAYVVQEFLDSGIDEILIISSRRKKVMEDYFDREPELEAVLAAGNKTALLQSIAPPAARVTFRRQLQMGGTGDAVLLAEEFAGGQPCVVAFPDDLHFGDPPLAAQLIAVHESTGGAVLALERHPDGDISRYGIAAIQDGQAGSDSPQVTGLVEKPATGTEPSRLVSIGRYLLTAETFRLLREEQAHHSSGEFYLTSGLHRQAAAGGVWGCAFQGERLDTGEPLGYYETIVRRLLVDPQLGAAFRTFLEAELAHKRS